MRSLHKQLRDISQLLHLDCGDNSCRGISEKSGARTNGGCRCDIAGAVGKLLELNEALKSEIEALKSETRATEVLDWKRADDYMRHGGTVVAANRMVLRYNHNQGRYDMQSGGGWYEVMFWDVAALLSFEVKS